MRTWKVEIDGNGIAEFYEEKFALAYAASLSKWEDTVDHLPHREHWPKRQIRVYEMPDWKVIYDSEQAATA